MAAECLAPRLVDVVADAELLACRGHDRRKTRVVDVADVGQQVVLHLVIQARRCTSSAPVARCEVHGRLNLVDGPLVLDMQRVADGFRECGIAADVRELEHDAQDQADRQHHQDVPQQHLPPGKDQQAECRT